MRWFKITNLEKYQHYSQRSPPWIKLYQNFIDDYDLARLGDAGRFHFAASILLASRSSNRLPWDPTWLQQKMSGDLAPDLDKWLEIGLITIESEDASIVLATCDSSNETVLERVEQRRGREETEKREREKSTRGGRGNGNGRFAPPSPEEVEEYGREIGFRIEGSSFVDYYAARGWKLKGGQSMKDWRAGLRTWQKNAKAQEVYDPLPEI